MKYIPQKLILFLIRFYQRAISPLFPSCCRFTPSCSEYCYQAIQRFGYKEGIKLGLKRLKKCHPLGPYGYDPVPMSLSEEVSVNQCNLCKEK